MPKENHTKYAILGLLTTGCHSGYAIKQMIDQSLNHFWKISYGQIYPMLKTLVDEELATVQTTAQSDRPDKKEYFITPKGISALQEWLNAPVQNIPVQKNELLLKLFFSRNQDMGILVNHIDQYLEKLRERFETYIAIEQMIDTYKNNQDKQYWLYTLDYGKRITKAAMDWCESTKEKIMNRS